MLHALSGEEGFKEENACYTLYQGEEGFKEGGKHAVRCAFYVAAAPFLTQSTTETNRRSLISRLWERSRRPLLDSVASAGRVCSLYICVYDEA